MARRRASMREGPLARLFRATEAAQRQKGASPAPGELSSLRTPARQSNRPRPSATRSRAADARRRGELSCEPSRRRRTDGRARSRRPRAKHRGRPGSLSAHTPTGRSLPPHRSPYAG